jgi:hypothetical protein
MTEARHLRRRAAAVVAVLVAAAVLLAGCSGGDDSGVQDTSQELGPAMAPDDERAQGDTGEATAGDAGEAGPVSAVTSPALEDRPVIYMVDLVVEVDDVGEASDQAEAVATRFGGFVESESTFGVPTPLPVEPGAAEDSPVASDIAPYPGDNQQSVLVLRVPADRYEQAVDELEAIGETVSRNRSAQDVTDEVVDVEARIETQQASIDRLQILLAEAEEISDILAIETELTQRIAELESLKARQEQLGSLTQLATVTVTFVPPETVVEEGSGFFAGLEAGWAAFVRSIEVGLTVLGAVLPFLAALALVVLPLIWLLVWRHRRRGRQSDGTPPASSASASGQPVGPGRQGAPEAQPRPPTGES